MDGSLYSDEHVSLSEGDKDRLDELERRVNSQADEITFLRSIVADLVKRISDLEASPSRGRASLPAGSNGTLTLPTKASASRSASRSTAPTTTPASARPSHHLSTESLQSGSLPRHSTGGLRTSPSVDRLGLSTPRGSAGKVTTTPVSARTTPAGGTMRKWTSNSDFQNGSTSVSHSHAPPSHSAYHSAAPPPQHQQQQPRSRFGSQSHLTDVPLHSHSPVAAAAYAASPTGFPKTSSAAAALKEPVFNPDDGYLRVNIRGKPMNFYVPSEECLTQSLAKPNPAPTERLKLEWVYGYRGRDCRSNLHYVATGECAYFIASVVVLVNFREELQRHYLGHTDDIRCIAVHPNRLTVASGQTGHPDRRPKRGATSPTNSIDGEKIVHVRIWDAVTLSTLHVLGVNGEFDRGFSALAFSKMDEGTLLAVIDESPEHLLSLWDWQKAGSRGDRIAMVACGSDPVFAGEFHPSVPNLLVTCGKSHINFWNLDGSTLALNRIVGVFEKIERPKFLLCLCFSENGDILTGDSNGNIISWGRAGNRMRHMVANAHPGGVFVLLSSADGQVVSGGKDRRIVVWDQGLRRTGQEMELPDSQGTARALCRDADGELLIGTNRNCILQGTLPGGFTVAVHGHFDEVWALATHPNHHQFVTASYDHTLTLWSAEEKVPIWTTELPDGIHALCFHPDGDLIAIATVSGRWFVLDTLSRDVVHTQAVAEDGQDLLSCIKYSPDGRFIAVASVDRAIYVYQVMDGGSKCIKLGKCLGHSSAVLCLDWSVDSQYLRSNSDNFELIYWNPATLKQINNPTLCRDVEWDSCNCILEYGVAGVWSDTVQALSVDCAQRVLAVGDDGGKVKLFSFPAMSQKSACHTYPGHSNHVSCVRFLHDASRLISSGGRDASVLQWICESKSVDLGFI